MINSKDGFPLVSVVVPVFNSIDYFEDTIKSIINQSYNSIEIILVNDGCTDGTEKIINKYSDLDSRITVINQKNLGTQFARHAGINKATGKYIQNLDCDDILLSDAIERLVAKAEKTGADMVAAPFFFCPTDRERYKSSPLTFDQLSGIDYFREICFKRAYWPTWTVFHKKELYHNNNIFLDPEIMMTEDTIHTTQLSIYSQKVVSIKDPIINFTVRYDSLSNNKSINDTRYRDLRKYPVVIEQFVRSKGLEQSLALELAFLKIRVTFESIAKRRLENLRSDFKEINKILKDYPELKKELSRREKKVLKVYKICPVVGYLNILRYIKQKKL